MTKNPILNALAASSYIVLVTTIMSSLTEVNRDKPDTIGAPIIVLSALTLSVTVMAFVFFYQPLQYFIEGKKKEAIVLFAHTVGAFAVCTIVAFALFFAGVI